MKRTNRRNRLIVYLLTVGIVFSLLSMTLIASAAITGDTNGDGDITPYDAVMILQQLSGERNLSTRQQSAGDINGDNLTDSTDAKLILDYVSGVIDGFGQPVTRIVLNRKSATLNVGGSATLSVTYRPTNAINRSVAWESDDEDVVIVDKNGMITGVGQGTAYVTATTSNGISAECKVTVNHGDSSKTIFLSPSNQTANLFAVGMTSEGVQMPLIAAVVKTELEKYDLNVVMADPKMDITSRATLANSLGVGTYVAIHSNAGGAQGTEAYYNPSTAGSKQLAQAVYDTVAQLTPTPDRGIKNGMVAFGGEGYAEVREPKMACTLLEVEFHDNVLTGQWILDNIKPLGKAVAQGILNYLGLDE